MSKGYYYQTPIGKIGIGEKEGYITNLVFPKEELPSCFQLEETPLLKKASLQLMEYFAGKRKSFQLPLKPEGTGFQRTVWDALLTIPYGEIKSYGEIAQQIGNPKACRAVGGANSRNPIAIFIPCHRVIGTNGKLTGFAGGLDIKEKLLLLEKGNGIK